jgi:hypothetical protein
MYYEHRFSGPAYGPRPRLVLEDGEDIESLLEGLRYIESDPVKKGALDRWLIYSEDYADLIRKQIDVTHYDNSIKARIFRHIKLSNNLALDVANAICNVWKHASTSHVSVEGASESENAALRELMRESGFHRHARSWNREAFLIGPTTAIPVVRGRTLQFDTLLPHFYATIDNPDDAWGPPLAAAWEIRPHRSGLPSAFQQPSRAATAVILDGDSWRYFEGKDGNFRLLDEVPHFVGEFPGATLDFDIAHGGTRWECDRHQRLIDATITVGAIEAILSFIRKSQNKQLLTMIGNMDGVTSGQTLEPEKPIVGRTDNPAQLALSVIDFDLDPENHIKHEAWIMQTIARSYGGQVASRPGSSSILEAEVSFSHEALTEARNEQIPFAKDFTRDLMAKAVMTCKRQRHPLATDLPDANAVREGLNVKYPPLGRSFASVDEQIKWQNHTLQRGTSRFEDILRPSMPDASEQELKDHIVANIKAQGEIIEMMTKRDQSVSPQDDEPGNVPKSETESQSNGRQGPEVRDENKDD